MLTLAVSLLVLVDVGISVVDRKEDSRTQKKNVFVKIVRERRMLTLFLLLFFLSSPHCLLCPHTSALDQGPRRQADLRRRAGDGRQVYLLGAHGRAVQILLQQLNVDDDAEASRL